MGAAFLCLSVLCPAEREVVGAAAVEDAAALAAQERTDPTPVCSHRLSLMHLVLLSSEVSSLRQEFSEAA